MPDFAKALRELKPAGTIAADVVLPPSGRFSLREQLEFLKSGQSRISGKTLPSGEVHSNRFGSHYVVHYEYPADYFHGKVRLNRFCSSDLDCLMKLMHTKGAVACSGGLPTAGFIVPREPQCSQRATINRAVCRPPLQRDRVVFLDTETTGMQGGTGICPFLVGIGFFTDSDFQMIQYFIRDFDEEPSMLLALAEQLKQFELVVTYNGAAFDIPLLETRFTLARMDTPFEGMSHFDLLFTARKLWRNGHGSCRLTALESELISFFRGPDIPGAMIPRVYFDFLQGRAVPALQSVFTHNGHDVVSLAALTVQASDRVAFEPAALDEPLDLFSLARVLEGSDEWQRSIRLYEMALGGDLPQEFRMKALESVAILYRRSGEHERSLTACEELMRCAEFSMVGYEGAAIYHERLAQNDEAALSILEAGLMRAEKNRSRRMLQTRWDRLQQKRLEFGAIKMGS